MSPYTMVVQSPKGDVITVTATNNPFRTLTRLQRDADKNSVITVWETGVRVYEVNV